MSYLDEHHIQRIHEAYLKFEDEEGFCSVVDIDTIVQDRDARMSVQLYVKGETEEEVSFSDAYTAWQASSGDLKLAMTNLFGNQTKTS